ncbi:MAG: 2-oxoglutarate dehydrogenase E1 subunit family protein, partial [Blastocatellia bacterium]
MTVTKPMTRGELDELIEAEFGVNADYVAHLYQQFERSPDSVDEEWREFFDGLLANAGAGAGNDKANGSPTPQNSATGATPSSQSAQSSAPPVQAPVDSESFGAPPTSDVPLRPVQPLQGAVTRPLAPPQVSTAAPAQVQPVPAKQESRPTTAEAERVSLKGPALRIAQNMETSLSVPTATSERHVSIKLLEEN